MSTSLRETLLVKRSLRLSGHRTSVSLEPEFWLELERIATATGMSLSGLVATIDATRYCGLASALRLLVLRDLLMKNNDFTLSAGEKSCG